MARRQVQRQKQGDWETVDEFISGDREMVGGLPDRTQVRVFHEPKRSLDAEGKTVEPEKIWVSATGNDGRGAMASLTMDEARDLRDWLSEVLE